MKNTFNPYFIGSFLFVLCNMFLQACTTTSASKTDVSIFTLDNVNVNMSTDVISYKNLQLYPIHLKANQHLFGEFVPLHKAIEDGKIEISEKSLIDSLGQGNDEVNRLFIENKSNDTIYLLSGEVVKGGKQDRTLSVDVVLEPHSGKQDVEVFCVEQHRWDPKAENMVMNKPLEEMKFKKSAPIVKNSIRKMATVDKEQVKVWDEVSSSNKKADVHSETDSYTAIENNVDYQKNEKEYNDYLQEKLRQNEKTIGFIAVSGNKIIGCDIFATHQIFISSMATILPSYINEAVHDGNVVKIEKAIVEKYYKQLLSNKASQDSFLLKNGNFYKYKDRAFHLNSY